MGIEYSLRLALQSALFGAMNGATSGVKAGTALSSNEERGHDAAGIARTSVIEDARLYPEVSVREDMPPFSILSKQPCLVVASA